MRFRSLLFLPGNSPAMLLNGTVLPADALILDLEDAVAPAEKDAARQLVHHALTALDYGARQIVIRINDLKTDFWRRDLELIVPCRPAAIMPPKIESEEQIVALSGALDALEKESGIPLGRTRLIPLLETAAGVGNAPAIARASERNVALFLGAEDYTADIGAVRTQAGDEIFLVRSQIVLAAKSAGLAAIDTPFTDAQDEAGLIADAQLAKGLGFTAKAAISPHHLRGIHQVFSPSTTEIDYALEVLEVLAIGKAEGKGAVALRGKMIDKPIETRARQTLELAEQLGLLTTEAQTFLESLEV